MARDEAYREAEQRIKAARQEEATELALSEIELTELPEAIASLTHLQMLNLSSKKLTRLPQAIASLTHLQMLPTKVFKKNLDLGQHSCEFGIKRVAWHLIGKPNVISPGLSRAKSFVLKAPCRGNCTQCWRKKIQDLVG